MNPPFSDNFMTWLQPLVAAIWGIVVIATPPPREGRDSGQGGREGDIPYVIGHLERAMHTLSTLVEGATHPSAAMLPVRMVMLPGSTGFSRFSYFHHCSSHNAPCFP